jgi:uncharacterized protein YndB with AHSA1/START domain
MADYNFETVWRLRAPIGAVWQAIFESEKWPQWWRGVVKVDELAKGDANDIGAKRRYVWRSKLPYTLAFEMETTRIEAPSLLEGHASGELEGTGTWQLSEADGVTTVRYTWRVKTTRPWMNLMAPLLRPAFAWNHDYVMARGAEGLAKLLGAELVSK